MNISMKNLLQTLPQPLQPPRPPKTKENHWKSMKIQWETSPRLYPGLSSLPGVPKPWQINKNLWKSLKFIRNNISMKNFLRTLPQPPPASPVSQNLGMMRTNGNSVEINEKHWKSKKIIEKTMQSQHFRDPSLLQPPPASPAFQNLRNSMNQWKSMNIK